jgi:hypothetical protein
MARAYQCDSCKTCFTPRTETVWADSDTGLVVSVSFVKEYDPADLCPVCMAEHLERRAQELRRLTDG